jgi:hypothetical protein
MPLIHDPRTRATVTLATGLTLLTADLLEQDLDVGDNAIWKPAKRAFLEALIRQAQLELAKDGLPPGASKVVHAHTHTHGSAEYAFAHLHTHQHTQGSESHDTREHSNSH